MKKRTATLSNGQTVTTTKRFVAFRGERVICRSNSADAIGATRTVFDKYDNVEWLCEVFDMETGERVG